VSHVYLLCVHVAGLGVFPAPVFVAHPMSYVLCLMPSNVSPPRTLFQEKTPLFIRRGEDVARRRGRRGAVSKHEADGRVVYEKCKHCGLRLARLRCVNCGQVQCEECCIWLHKQASRRHHKVKPLHTRATTTGVDIRDPLRLQDDLLKSNIAVAQDLVTRHHQRFVSPFVFTLLACVGGCFGCVVVATRFASRDGLCVRVSSVPCRPPSASLVSLVCACVCVRVCVCACVRVCACGCVSFLAECTARWA